MHTVLRWARMIGGSLIVAATLALLFAAPAGADSATTRSESSDLVSTEALSFGTVLWGVAGAAALIVGWAMTRRPSTGRASIADQVVASN